MSDLPLPRNLVASARGANNRGQSAWLERLPGKVREIAKLWSLDLGPAFEPGGQTAWVAPVRTATNSDLVLKVMWRHDEAEHEADGLREWNAEGAVRLYKSAGFEDTIALLLERCAPGTTLAEQPEAEQDSVVASLLTRLWREPQPIHTFPSLTAMCTRWADEHDLKMAARRSSLDPALEREGMALFRSLPATAAGKTLLCTDLHAGNILAADREPWLMIDPKPCVGDPTYDALQHMLNCEQRLHADPHGLASRMADLLGLDRDRLVLWLFARCVQESPDWPALGDVARRLAPT